MKIFINPGHDILKDSGAINEVWGVTEAQIVKEIGFMVQQKLQQAGHQVMLLQNDNLCGEAGTYASAVCTRANDWEADVFISVHCNSAYTNQANGTETYCYCFGGEGEKLAACIQHRLVNMLDMVDRGVKEANFIVLRHTNMPAVLVELAFINNTGDVRKLCTRKEDFAEAVTVGILDYIGEW